MKFGKVGSKSARSTSDSADICKQDDVSEYTVEVEEIRSTEQYLQNPSMAPDPGVEISFVKKSSSARSNEKVIRDVEASSNIFGMGEKGKMKASEQDKYRVPEITSIMDMIQTDTGTTDEDDENDTRDRGLVNKLKQSKICTASKILLIALLIGGALAASYFATRAIITRIRSKSAVSDDISNQGASQTQGIQQINETSMEQARRTNEISQLIRSISKNSTLENPSSPQSKAFTWLAYNDQLQLSLTGNNNVSKARLTQRYVMSLFYYSLNGGGWKNITSWLSSEAECSWEQVECINNRVTTIDLTGKNVSGSIPEEISNLNDLENLILYDNKITSSIPSSIGKLKSLDTLDLGKNQMTGTVPNKFYMLESLRIAFLKSNKFEGSISSSVGLLSNLEMFVISRNRFQGIAPAGLGNLTNLYVMDLSQNNFTGKFPFKAISTSTSLQYLDLSLNSFTGSLPNAVSDLTALYQLTLSNNKFTGDIPSSLDNLSRLQVLQLNNNTFSGNITKSLGNLLVLETLALEGNNFSGSIPNSVCSLATSRSLTEITSDCLKSVVCKCCTTCY